MMEPFTSGAQSCASGRLVAEAGPASFLGQGQLQVGRGILEVYDTIALLWIWVITWAIVEAPTVSKRASGWESKERGVYRRAI